VPTGYPLVIWRDSEGFMKACACMDARSWPFIRDDFNAPDRVAAPGVGEPVAPVPPGLPAPVPGDGSLPYPTLPAIPPIDGQPVPPAQPGTTAPATGQGGGQSAPRPRPAQPRQTQPNTPPQPTQQDDTTFF
jgi:hypothetical protein